MIKKTLIVLMLVLLVGIVSAADVDSGIACTVKADCLDAGLNESSYCKITKGTCFVPPTATNTTNTTNTTSINKTITKVTIPVIDTAALKKQVEGLETTVGSINTKTSGLENDIFLVKNDLTNLKTQVGGIQAQLTQLNSQLDSSLGSIETTLATGLATLQGDLDITQTEIQSLEEDVAKSNTTRNIMFGLLIIVVGGLVTWFLVKKPKQEISPEVSNYINSHIKQGMKFEQIKQNLLEAGWAQKDIETAYNKTVKDNYQKYLKQKGPKNVVQAGKVQSTTMKQSQKTVAGKTTETKKKANNSKKTILILVIGVVFLAGAFFLLKATTGQAINFGTNFAHDAPLECTPPHITTEGGCCLDNNNNSICDTTDEANALKATVDVAICQDDSECSVGKTCVDNTCSTIAQQFTTDCPGEFKCNLNNIKIKTSDGELYTVYSKKGSYAAAGAVDWTIQEIPNYCKGQQAKIPIEIQKKDLVCYDINGVEVSCNEDTGIACSNDIDCNTCQTAFGNTCTCDATKKTCKLSIVDKIKSETVNKETITLNIGETSKQISHPNPKLDTKLNGFTLTVLDANEFCFPGN